MHYTLDRSQPGEIKAAITLDAAEVDAAIGKYKENARIMLADKAAEDVLAREQIASPGRPMYEGGDLQQGAAYAFTARFALLPAIAPADYSALEVRMEEPAVSQDELRNVFLGLLRRNGVISEVEDGRPAEGGDIAIVDIDASVDGMDVPGMTARDLRLRLDESSGERLAAVRSIVLGMRAGETGTGAMSCPKDFPEEAFREQRVDLRVTLKSLLREKLPTLDDAFAKRLGFDSLQALEKKALADATDAKAMQIRARAAEDVLARLMQDQKFPLPEPMRVLYVNNELGAAAQELRRQGAAQEEIPARLEAARPAIESRAAWNARVHCYLLAVARDQKLEVPEDEVSRALAGMAGPDGNVAELRFAMERNGGLKELRERMLAVRAMDFIFQRVRKASAA